MIKEILKKDLRKISEEEFSEVFNWLKNESENFSKFPEEVFLKNNQIILILRCALGLSRASFARKVGINEKTLRHIEARREQNKIKSFKIAKRWCEKIANFLKNNTRILNKETSCILWKEIKERQHLEKNIELEGFIKERLEELRIPSDLREIDKKKFIQLFQLIQSLTNNFRKIPPELLTARSDLLLILRCCLGLSRKELANKLGIPNGTLRRIEKGRNKIKNIGPALRWVVKLQPLFSQIKVTLDCALSCFERFKVAKDMPLKKVDELKSVKNLSEQELQALFENIKFKTNNFTNFPPELFREDPRIISILRISLGLGIKSFSKLIKKDESHVRRWENLKMRIRFKTALSLSQSFAKLFSNKNICWEEFLNNLKLIHKFRIKEIDNSFKNGLRSAENQPTNETEEMIKRILVSKTKTFKIHATVEGIKRMENVDFLILSESKPTAVIEVFKFSGKHFHNLFNKVTIIDHKFQMLKLLTPTLKTIVCIHIPNITTARKEMIENLIKSQLLNTDELLINEFNKITQMIP
jgi:ribosome-binding protein aMBF1 (putative translation factor)